MLHQASKISDFLTCHTLPSAIIKIGNINYNHKEFLSSNSISCQNCHRNVVRGQGKVKREKCLTCHNKPENFKRFNDEAFMHQNHVTDHHVPCLRCHDKIEHGITSQRTFTMGNNCAECHTQTHDPERDLYRGVGALGVPSMPSPMFYANVDCSGCHLNKKTIGKDIRESETMTGSEKGCTKCHGKEYVGVLLEGNKQVKNTLAKLEAKRSAIDKAVAGLPTGAISAPLKKQLADVSHNLRFLSQANSAHNIYYVARILQQADQALNAAAQATKFKASDLSQMPLLSGQFCMTLCHARIGVKVPAETVMFRKKKMPHKAHVVEQELACFFCHEFGSHKQVKFKGIKVCAECHEPEEIGGK